MERNRITEVSKNNNEIQLSCRNKKLDNSYTENDFESSLKDIFDIEDKEFKARVDINQTIDTQLLRSSDGVCLNALETCQPSGLTSQEDTLLIDHNSDTEKGEKSSETLIIHSNIRKIEKSFEIDKLNKFACSIYKLFCNYDQSNSTKRILHTFLGGDDYLFCVVKSDEISFYLKNKHQLNYIINHKRYHSDRSHPNILNSIVLLNYSSNSTDYHACLKSFTISREGTIQFVKDYSYYCFFNIYSYSNADCTSSEDELSGERGNIYNLNCISIDENACLLSYFLPSCNQTKQSILLYQGESSQCDHYRLPSVYGRVSSYQPIYNVPHCFITLLSGDNDSSYIWNISLKPSEKLFEERVEARKSKLPKDVLSSVIGNKCKAILLAYEMGLIILKITDKTLSQTIKVLCNDNPSSEIQNERDHCITEDIENISDTYSKMSIILPDSDFDLIIEAENSFYRLHPKG